MKMPYMLHRMSLFSIALPCSALALQLEKFKFVLDYKIKELKRQIEPRENEISDMRNQIEEMDLELEQVQYITDKSRDWFQAVLVQQNKYMADECMCSFVCHGFEKGGRALTYHAEGRDRLEIHSTHRVCFVFVLFPRPDLLLSLPYVWMYP